MKPLIKRARLLELLIYNSDEGTMRWRVPKGPARNRSVAGTVTHEGYWRLKLDGRDYMAHRLAWFYVHAVWPTEIDHANGNPSDNRLSNLRECSRSQNLANRRRRTGKETPKGVIRKNHRYEAYITLNKRRMFLGSFLTADEAQHTYLIAARQHFGNFANSGDPVTTAKQEGE